MNRSVCLGLFSALFLHSGQVVAEPLSGAELEALLSGSTVTASRMGMSVRMTFDPSGEVQASMGIMRGSGQWQIEGDTLCLDMPRQPADMPRCQTFERTDIGIRSAAGTELVLEP